MPKCEPKRVQGPVDYIRSRRGTRMLHFRYQFPRDVGGGTHEESLRTSDLQVARARAAVLLTRCYNRVEEERARRDNRAERHPSTTLDYKFRPGEHRLADGVTVHADEDWNYYVAPNGKRWHERNRIRRVIEGEGMTLAEYVNRIETDTLHEDEIDGVDCPGWRNEPIELPADWAPGQVPADGGIVVTRVKAKAERVTVRPGPDDEFLEVYLKHRNITGYHEVEARRSWSDFRMLSDGKPLRDCDRADGRKLVDYYFAQGNKRATVQKKLMYLCAMTNLAMDEPKPKITFNPFSKVIPDIEDAIEREPMSEKDVNLIRNNKARFKPEQWLLYMLCATTGMRRDEVFSIRQDRNEAGIRYVIIGEKTKQSKRRVPLPDAVLPYLPETITGPVFAPNLTAEVDRNRYIKNLGREVLRQMQRIGVETPGLHTLRHRAKDRLREAGITHDQQEELLGHERKTVADGYGKGYPVRVLKEWIEKIGY